VQERRLQLVPPRHAFRVFLDVVGLALLALAVDLAAVLGWGDGDDDRGLTNEQRR
jgi:hypothetical protein